MSHHRSRVSLYLRVFVIQTEVLNWSGERESFFAQHNLHLVDHLEECEDLIRGLVELVTLDHMEHHLPLLFLRPGVVVGVKLLYLL